GCIETIVFTYLSLFDDNGVTTNLASASTAQKNADGVRKVALAVSVPTNQLAILGSTLPRVVNGAAPDTTKKKKPVADPVNGGGAGPEADGGAPGGGDITEGLAALFTFDDGTSLFDRIDAGEIQTTADLISALQELAGSANVVDRTTNPDQPRIELHLTKTIEGSGNLDVAFDKFGGHAALRGAIDVS